MQQAAQERARRRWQRRRQRVAKKLRRSDRVVLTVYRSARHIYAQLVDQDSGHTLGAVSTRSREVRGDLETTGNVKAAERVGSAIARLAREKQIERVVFNRNGFLYHGRVKALADAAREAGLRF